MKRMVTFAVVCVFLVFGLQRSHASGPLGVYGIVDKVVFEPNEASPQRIQVWGVFKYATDSAISNPALSPATRGYLYFTLPVPGPQADSAMKEWSDLKAVAGTGQVVGFGSGWFSSTETRVRPATERPAAPSPYHLNIGIVKLSASGTQAAIVRQLKDATGR